MYIHMKLGYRVRSQYFEITQCRLQANWQFNFSIDVKARVRAYAESQRRQLKHADSPWPGHGSPPTSSCPSTTIMPLETKRVGVFWNYCQCMNDIMF